MTTMKNCTCCGKEKPASDYRLHSDRKTVMRYCNDCHLAKRRAQPQEAAWKMFWMYEAARHCAKYERWLVGQCWTARTTTQQMNWKGRCSIWL